MNKRESDRGITIGLSIQPENESDGEIEKID